MSANQPAPDQPAADQPAADQPAADQPAPDTDDLRSGAPLHDGLLALLPLLGRWRGSGVGVIALSGEQFSYGQQVSFVHDGRPFLAYESRSWLTRADGCVVRQAWRESGFWRPGAAPDDLEVVIASNTGQALVFDGSAGDLRWDLATVSASHSRTARPVGGERRLYAVLGDALTYATELSGDGIAYSAHHARLNGPDRTTPHAHGRVRGAVMRGCSVPRVDMALVGLTLVSGVGLRLRPGVDWSEMDWPKVGWPAVGWVVVHWGRGRGRAGRPCGR